MRNIGVDIDEILFPLKEPLYEYVGDRFNVKLDWRTPNYDFGIELGLPYEERVGLYYDFIKTEEYHKISPIEGAVEGVKALKEMGNLYAITSRQNFIRDHTQKSLDTYFPGMFSGLDMGNHHNIHDPNNERTKLDMCLEKDIDLFVEDQTKYAVELDSKVPMILYDTPWNQGFEKDNVYRAMNWTDVVDIAKGILSPSSQF